MIILFLLQILIILSLYSLAVLIYGFYYKLKIASLLDGINCAEDLLFMNFKDYVHVVAEAFRRKGYTVKLTEKCGEDENGLILNNKLFVEVWKHGFNHSVDVEVAMKLAGHMERNSVFRGMIISLGIFKQSTQLYCHKNVIDCINKNQLLELCKDVQNKSNIGKFSFDK